jgi:hypothetical protein
MLSRVPTEIYFHFAFSVNVYCVYVGVGYSVSSMSSSSDLKQESSVSHDVFYAFGHDLLPTIPATGLSTNVYEYSPNSNSIAHAGGDKDTIEALPSREVSVSTGASREIISTYDLLVMRDDEVAYGEYVANLQLATADMAAIPKLMHIQTHGDLAVLSDIVLKGDTINRYNPPGKMKYSTYNVSC